MYTLKSALDVKKNHHGPIILRTFMLRCGGHSQVLRIVSWRRPVGTPRGEHTCRLYRICLTPVRRLSRSGRAGAPREVYFQLVICAVFLELAASHSGSHPAVPACHCQLPCATSVRCAPDAGDTAAWKAMSGRFSLRFRPTEVIARSCKGRLLWFKETPHLILWLPRMWGVTNKSIIYKTKQS